MRVGKQIKLSITSGKLVICDVALIENQEKPDEPYFDLFGGDGDFKVYQDGNIIVVDTAPRLFKAKTRPHMKKLPGRVSVDTSHLGFRDGTQDFLNKFCTTDLKKFAVIVDIPNGDYITWSEKKDWSTAYQDTIICFGKKVELFLSKTYATDLFVIEKQLATALRMKGRERQTEKERIKDALMNIHMTGIKDERLSKMAALLKLKLPRIKKNKKK